MAKPLSECSWLFDPSLLKLVHQCRRLIQSEFGIKLHLTEENLEQRLAEFARQSRSAHLTRTWSALTERVPELAPATKETTVRRTYRGQEIPDSLPGAEEENGARAARKKKVIYRGQVIG